MLTGADIAAAAKTLRNTPYKHQGRTPNKELDCIGVVILSAKIVGALPQDFDFKNYSRYPDGSLQRELKNHCVELEKISLGAIALFKIAETPQLCGIITGYRGGWGLIHAYENSRAVREHQLIDWWQSKICKLYGFREVDYGS